MGSASLLGRTSRMALGTLISRLTGVIRDIALVAAIGTGVFSDTYSVANSIPNIVYILIAGGAINAVFIPELMRHIADDEDNGKAFTDRLITLVGLILLGIVIVAIIGANSLAHLYGTAQWTLDDFDVASAFIRWCIPQVLFYGIFTVLSQVLNSRDVYGIPMYAPIINNVIVIVTALSFAGMTALPSTSDVSSTALTVLGFGTTFGVVAQALVLLPAIHKIGYSYQPRFDFAHTGLGKVGDLAFWTFGFVLVNQLSFVVISKLTTRANAVNSLSGAIGADAIGFTSYQKGQLMMMLPHSIIAVSIITALLPRLSNHAHEHDNEKMQNDIVASLRLIIVLIIPSALALFVLGPKLGGLLYGFGNATSLQGYSVGFIASMFALGLPAFSIFYLLLRVYYAQQNTKTPFYINLIFNILHLAIGFSLYRVLPARFMVAGLAIGYSIAYFLVCLTTWRRIGKRLPAVTSPEVIQHVVRTFVASFISGLVLWFINKMLWSTNALVTVAYVLVELVIFVGIFFFLARQMKIKEIKDVSQLIRRG